jgi:hypothetical protein
VELFCWLRYTTREAWQFDDLKGFISSLLPEVGIFLSARDIQTRRSISLEPFFLRADLALISFLTFTPFYHHLLMRSSLYTIQTVVQHTLALPNHPQTTQIDEEARSKA